MTQALKLLSVLCPLSLLTFITQAQTALKQSDLENFSIGRDIEKLQPQNITYKDGKPLAEGDYAVTLDKEGRKVNGTVVSFHANKLGKVDGEMRFVFPDPSFGFKAFYHNDTLIRLEKSKDGHLTETNYLENRIVYKKQVDANGDFKSEYRYKDGAFIYSKMMNLSGWDIQDEIKGTREFYYGKTDIIESRITTKNADKNIIKTEEKFDEKGHLLTKEIQYQDGKTKTISKDGSYEIAEQTNEGEQISRYSSTGKLLKKFIALNPTMSSPTP